MAKSVPHSDVWDPTSIDPKSLQALQKTIRKLGAVLETPGDTVQRIGYLVREKIRVHIGTPVEVIMYRVFSRLPCGLG